MKKFFTIMVIVLTAITTNFAQSTFDVMNSNGTPEVSTEQASAYNPYFGFKLAYNLDESRPVSESFLLSAKITKVLASGPNFAFPVASSFGLNSDDVTNPESGFNAGVFPWLNVTKNADSQLKFIVHGGLNYKVVTENVEGEAPQQIKVLGGVEAVFDNKQENTGPVTLSVTPVWYFNNVLDDFGALEITAVIPVARGLALLAESTTPFQNGVQGDVRFGILATINNN